MYKSTSERRTHLSNQEFFSWPSGVHNREVHTHTFVYSTGFSFTLGVRNYVFREIFGCIIIIKINCAKFLGSGGELKPDKLEDAKS